MNGYESPKISFDRLILFEKIADSCWAGNTTIHINDITESPQDPEAEWSVYIPKKVLDSDCGDDEMLYFMHKVGTSITDPCKLLKFMNDNKFTFSQNTKIGDWKCKS